MMYERFAGDLSESLFGSVYQKLYGMAAAQQRAIYLAHRTRKGRPGPGYHIGEHQEALNAFCKGSLSLGHALDHIRIHAPRAPARVA